MRLLELHLDDVVVIPGARDVAGGTPVKREQSFHADDGWDLREVLPGTFSISRADMEHAVTVGGFGYTYVPMPPVAADPVMRAQDEYAAASLAQQQQDAIAGANAQQAAYHRKGKR